MAKFVRHRFVAHVGAMDSSLKNEGSHEGAGLSVSINPMAWGRIHRIGDEGFILEGPGRFLDAMRLTKAEREVVWDWAKDHGLVQEAMVWTVSYEDDELEETIEFECSTEEEAEAEAEEIMDAVVGSRMSTVATKKLAELCHHNPGRISPLQIPSDFQFDLVLSLWAEEHLDVDGIWWNERLEPEAYSAPRGVIFASRMSEWTARAASREELEDFECGAWTGPRVPAP